MSDFQSAASAQGAIFDSQCRLTLERLGLKLSNPFVVPDVGIEVDTAATVDGAEFWVEFKGSWLSDRPGLRRTDTTKKAIANGALVSTLPTSPPFIVLTSHMPASGSAGDVMLTRALAVGFIDFVGTIDRPDMERLSEWIEATA